MATLSLTYAFPSTAQGWVFTETNNYGGHGGFDSTGWDGSIGNPAGSLHAFSDPRNTAGAVGYWGLSGTWTSLGIPSGATVTAIQVTGVDEKITDVTAGSITIGPHVLADGGGTTQATLVSSRTATVVDGSWQGRSGSSQSVPSGIQPAGSTVSIRLAIDIGDIGTSGGEVYLDNVAVTITYTPGSSATGTAAGSSTAVAVGASQATATATAGGSSAALAVGASLRASAGTAAGSSSASATGVGAVPIPAAGSSAGSSAASAVGVAATVSAGTASGDSLADAFGTWIGPEGAGEAFGQSGALAIGASVVASVGTAAGSSTAVGAGGSSTSSFGTAAGLAIAEGVGAHAGSPVNPTGEADGSAGVSGVGSSIASGSGTASGDSTAGGTAPTIITGLFRWMPPACGGCCTSPPPPPPVAPTCAAITVASGSPTPTTIPTTIHLTRQQFDPVGGSPPFRTLCWDEICTGIPHVDPDLGLTTAGWVDPSGPYVYGPPPGDVSAGFPAGFRAFFNPTPHDSTFAERDQAFNCDLPPRYYRFIGYVNDSIICYLYFGIVAAAYTRYDIHFPIYANSDTGGVFGWWWGDAGNSLSPLYLKQRGTVCRGIITA